MWTPSERWMPEQARQKKMPSLGEACHDQRLVRGCLNWHCYLLVGVVVKLYLSLSTPSYVETYPLWTGSTTVDAPVVIVRFGDFAQFRASLRIDLPHFTHLCETVLYSCMRMLVGCR